MSEWLIKELPEGHDIDEGKWHIQIFDVASRNKKYKHNETSNNC